MKHARARKKRRTRMTETRVHPLKSKSLVFLLTDAIYQRTSFTPTIQLGHTSRNTQIEKGGGNPHYYDGTSSTCSTSPGMVMCTNMSTLFLIPPPV